MSYRLISVKPWTSYSNCTVQGNTEGRRHMRTSDASYLAGFFDGDGSLYFQLVRQEEYRFGYYIRVSISFSQVTSSRDGLEHVRTMIGAGYVRDRGTGMSDLVITSRPVVQDVLTNMQPFVIFKRAQVREALRILPMIRPRMPSEEFLQVARLVDVFAPLNHSKAKRNNAADVEQHLRGMGVLAPVTTHSNATASGWDCRESRSLPNVDVP